MAVKSADTLLCVIFHLDKNHSPDYSSNEGESFSSVSDGFLLSGAVYI